MFLCTKMFFKKLSQWRYGLWANQLATYLQYFNCFNRGRKTSLKGNVYTLVQCEHQEPIVLYEDGRISRSSSPNDYLCAAHDKKIIWVDSIKERKKRMVVCTVVQDQMNLEALVYVIEKNSQSIQPQKIVLHGKNV